MYLRAIQEHQPDQKARKSSDHQVVSASYGETRSGNLDQTDRRAPGGLGASTLTTEYQAYLILQSNNRTRIAEKQSKSWFSRSRVIRTHGQHGDLRALRNLFQETMPRLYYILGNWHRVLFMWNKSKTLAIRTKQFDKKNYDALSITSYVIEKNLIHGAKHGASEWQRMYYKAKEMLQKARQTKHGGHKDDQYRRYWVD